MEATDFFSPDYVVARERFREAAKAAGAVLHELPLDATGPQGEALTIDIAWLGHTAARHVVLHTSGLHGVEAFAGSAIQLSLLGAPPAIEADCALVFVHVLNPYGMAWIRRANENNVDLNRNFLAATDEWSGAPPLYSEIDPLLNPASPPGPDLFLARALWLILRHGFHALKQAVAQGQYDFPRGLFFGGHELQPGPRRYIEWLQRHLSNAGYLFGLDVHTGLGRWGDETVLLEGGRGATPLASLRAALSRPLVDVQANSSVAYTIRGGMGTMLPRALPHAAIDFVIQELGTYPPLRVFHALREENRWHHYGRSGIDHVVKRRMREALCPQSPEWRRQVVARGRALAHAAADWAFRNRKA